MTKKSIVFLLLATAMVNLCGAVPPDAEPQKGDPPARPSTVAKKTPVPPNPFSADFKQLEKLQKKIEEVKTKKTSFSGWQADRAKKDVIEQTTRKIGELQERISKRIEVEQKKLEDEQARLQTMIEKLSAKEGSEAEVEKLQVKITTLSKQVDQWNSWGNPPVGSSAVPQK